MSETNSGFMIWTVDDKIMMSCDKKLCDDRGMDFEVMGPSNAWPDLKDLFSAAAKHRIAEHPTCPECSAGKHQNCDGVGGITESGDLQPCGCDYKTPLNSARHP